MPNAVGETRSDLLLDRIVEVEHRAWLSCEFEARQMPRLRTNIFRKCEHLKRPAEHFGMEQGL